MTLTHAERKQHTIENLNIINSRLEILIPLSRSIRELESIVEILADFFHELSLYMLKVIDKDYLPESLMGRLLPLSTGHKNSPNIKEEMILRRLIQQSGFTKSEEIVNTLTFSVLLQNPESTGPENNNTHDISLNNNLIKTIKENE